MQFKKKKSLHWESSKDIRFSVILSVMFGKPKIRMEKSKVLYLFFHALFSIFLN